MALVSRFATLLLWLPLLVNSGSGPVAQVGLPENVFARDYTTAHYSTWWRPRAVVFDGVAVPLIQERVEAIAEDEVSAVDIAAAFGELADSAFLAPVLAANGRKGLALLHRLLHGYAQGAGLDDRWLMIVASLSRTGTAEAEAALLEEMKRVQTEGLWKESGPFADPGAVRAYDPRRALVDALIACQVIGGRLSAQGVQETAQRFAGAPIEGLAWILALDWAHQILPADRQVALVVDVLGLCSDEDFQTQALAQKAPSPRLLAVTEFLARDVATQRIARDLVLLDHAWRPAVVLYLRDTYAGVLVNEAQFTRGHYSIDDEVRRFFTRTDAPTSRRLAWNCAILQAATPSDQVEGWAGFIQRHAAGLDPQDADFVQYVVAERILKEPEVAVSRRRRAASPRKYGPGVHLRGFGPVP